MPLFMGNRRTREEDETGPIKLTEELDYNFDCLMRVAKTMCQTLGRPKDHLICRSTLDELIKFNRSGSPEVKQHVRKFLRFYLQVLRWTQTHQPTKTYEKWYGDACNSRVDPTANKDEEYVWLEEGVSYLAMKQFEDGSTMIYSAVAKDPGAGWADNGLRTLAEQLGN
ncbi:uncharacterized protein LOC133847899 [Drosophila sulfurigaster albostrigata]|uniref:uncharacterized protein LOC133847899 n=1 Tax=Drosophila sulfurigaster albostrigata TaxID=89887 RepID=UPI002D21A99A|nr:uncharacterized protein LOC133847899 [Drosophila sulfurigaster albostrigata]